LSRKRRNIKIKVLSPRDRFRPLVADISGTHYQSTACTISAFFRKDDKILIASNMHCFGRENNAQKGDPILQPSPYDLGTLDDKIGTFLFGVELNFISFKCPYRNFFLRKIWRPKELYNLVDISFAELTIDFLPEVLNLGTIKGKREISVGEIVRKCGRTSEVTTGEVISTSWSGQVQYSRGMGLFTDCILIQGNKFSQPGDSGSPILDEDNNLIGVLFAGSDNYTIVCKIGNIERIAGVTLITGVVS
jgi:hypothetical protein